MMKTVIMSLSSILDSSNKRKCLLVSRALGECYKCNLYKDCESKIVNPEYEDLIRKRLELYKEASKVSKKIEDL